MKKRTQTITIFSLFLSFFLGCNQYREPHAVLLEMEKLFLNHPDSAWIALENLNIEKQFDEHDRSYYYLLLTEARNKNEVSLLSSDSLIDFALQKINAKTYPALAAKAHLLKGRIKNELQEPQEAIKSFYQGIALLEESDIDLDILSKLYDELGTTYLYQFMYEDALAVFHKEYENDLKIGDPRGLAFSLRNFGSLYQFKEQEDSAFYYLNEALKFAKQSEDSVYLCDFIYNDLALWYMENNEYEQALLEMDKIKIEADNNRFLKSGLFIHLGQLDSARILLKAINTSDIYSRAGIYDRLSLIATKENDFESALQYSEIYHSIIDSINDANKVKDIKIIDHKYKSETVVDRLKEQHKKRTMIILFSFIIAILTVILFLLSISKKRKVEKVRRDKEFANLRAEIALTENEILKMQTANEKNLLLIETKEEEKMQLLNSLFEIEKSVFRKKEVYAKLQKNNSNTRKGLSSQEMNALFIAVEESFVETIKQLKQRNPGIKQDVVAVYCLKKIGFVSKEIGLFFNKEESTIRYKLRGIR